MQLHFPKKQKVRDLRERKGGMMVAQAAIVFFSGLSIWAFSGKRYRLGFLSGLCGQPFWFFTSFHDGQWGVFLVSIWFTLNHARGLWAHRHSEGSFWRKIA